MSAINHELIRASAGTGKTHQLTNRFLKLLFATGQPERIVALTFTRKSAGDFFDKIFQRLSGAAQSPEAASVLSAEIGLRVDADACAAHLRILLDRLHRLQLSTYDSFFGRIVHAFPFELGLAGTPALLSESERLLAIQRTQQALSRRTIKDAAFLREFWQACKRATMGVESKTITEIVGEFIRNNHSLFFDAPMAAQWGDPETIWQGHCPWTGAHLDPIAESSALRAEFNWDRFSPKQREQWEEFVSQLAEWRPPAEAPDRVQRLGVKLLEAFEQLDSGSCTITVQKKQLLSCAQGLILKRVARFFFFTQLKPRLEATRGIYDMVRLFEEVYSQEVRLMGQITLDDATRLLGGGATHGRGLSDAELRSKLAFRLDGSFDHWLLDEFQDTSTSQWRAVEELVDEVLQDPEGRRTFFAVGDAKQSIYRWRGGDDRLFDRVHDRYRAALSVRLLSESYRSVPAVLAIVNRVFENNGSIEAMTGSAVASRWGALWQNHLSAVTLSNIAGYSCLIHAPAEDQECFATILSLLKELRPQERGLSIAILTLTNQVADDIVEYIRSNGGPPCSLAANVLPGTDNVVAAGLRSMLTIAAHPADSLAWVHLQMSPMGAYLFEQFRSASKLSEHLLMLWSRGGIVSLVEYWSDLCMPHLDVLDGFNGGRLNIFRNAASMFDRRGQADIDAFLHAMERIELREHDTPGQVAVMTVHKAKGLDWDAVILTDLSGKTLRERGRGGLDVQRGADGEIEWICDLPTSAVAKCDSVMGALIESSGDDAAFERLCVLYVGMTRARRGLYVVTRPASGTSQNYFRLLDTALAATPKDVQIGAAQFACAWEDGSAGWFGGLEPAKPTAKGELAPACIPENEHRADARTRAVLPSTRNVRINWAAAFGGQEKSAREFGVELHKTLATIEWLPGTESGDAKIVSEATDGASEQVQAAVRAVLSDPACRAFFLRPVGDCSVWREMPFEIVRNGEWITGRFDRVVLGGTDLRGVGRTAFLIDFKTAGPDVRLEPDAFVGQMRTYATALAQLCGLPTQAVSAAIVLVQGSRTAVRNVNLA